MPRLASFISLSIDGYFTGANGDLSWAHRGADPEFGAFVADNARGGGRLLFGRVTYDMMVGYWPTPAAARTEPAVAERMNALPKIVASRSLARADWRNTTLIRDDLVGAVAKLKGDDGPDIAILGSGSLVAQLTEAALIDELQVVVIPVILGEGRALFEGVRRRRTLALTESRSFANGNVFHRYRME
jgi:dihydrofolate reductase